MRITLSDGKVTKWMYLVNKSPITMMYLVPSKVSDNGPMQVAVAVSQGLDIETGSNETLDKW